jgi:proteasome lid subunit RPN8/RPN11
MSFNDFKTLNDSLHGNLGPDDGPETGGVILNDGSIVEIPSIHPEPNTGYQPDPVVLLALIDQLAGTWHTHPGATSNLSVEDAETFVNWPDLTHAIIGTDGVRWYRAKGSAVINV